MFQVKAKTLFNTPRQRSLPLTRDPNVFSDSDCIRPTAPRPKPRSFCHDLNPKDFALFEKLASLNFVRNGWKALILKIISEAVSAPALTTSLTGSYSAFLTSLEANLEAPHPYLPAPEMVLAAPFIRILAGSAFSVNL